MRTALTMLIAFFSLQLSAEVRVTSFGDVVRNVRAAWANELQGICHDDENLYVTARFALWKIPKSAPLTKVKAPDKKSGVTYVNIPQHLRAQGGDHMGDCDVHDGLIYVPLEGTNPVRIMLFDAKTLLFKSAPTIPAQGDAPWLSVDPHSGNILMGRFNIGPEGLQYLALSPDLKTLTHVGRLIPKKLPLLKIQGGDIVRSRNLLWLVSDTKSGGLFALDLETGETRHHQTIAYKPGFPLYEELEGMDALEDQEAPHPLYQGNLLVTMLVNNLIRQDAGYLKAFDY